MFLKSIFTGVLIFNIAHSAPKKASVVMTEFITPPEVEMSAWNVDEYKESNKQWKTAKRNVASDVSDTTKDFKNSILKPWLDVNDSEGLSTLLNKSYSNYNSYANAPDVQYFLAQLHLLIPLKGIVWRMRPLFEKGPGLFGNRTTHMSAIQFVRGMATGLQAAFPTHQTDAMIGYLTKPGLEMDKSNQFYTIEQFQRFLTDIYVPFLADSAKKIKDLNKANPTAVFVWDNKMFYGTGSFRDGFKQFVGHGPVERHVAAGGMYEAIHDAYVFSAYNQNELINVAAFLGRKFGIDVARTEATDELGMTDKERIGVFQKLVEKDKKNGFLTLRKFGMIEKLLNLRKLKGKEKSELGNGYMMEAFVAKENAVKEFNEAYIKVDGKSANETMAINPGLYQKEVQTRLNAGVTKMVSAINGSTEFRDPVSSEVVVLDVPNFYKNPPESLFVLMANDWEPEQEKFVINSKKQKLDYRNYFSGRSNSWNNAEWGKYVTSANGKGRNYMLTAKRVLHYSLGAGPVFGVVDIFVR